MLCVLTGDAVSPESEAEWSPYLVTVHFSETDIDGQQSLPSNPALARKLHTKAWTEPKQNYNQFVLFCTLIVQ